MTEAAIPSRVRRFRSSLERLSHRVALFAPALLLLIAATPTATAQPVPSLETLPFIRDAPIEPNGDSRDAPTAFTPPTYCDSDTLRESATLRAVRFFDDRRGVAVGDHGAMWLSVDGGASWQSTDSGVRCRLDDAIWLSADRVIAVGGGYDPVTRISRGVVVFSNDSGRTWRRGSDQELPRLYALTGEQDAATARRTSRRVVIAIGDEDPVTGNSRFESIDGGRNWQAVSPNSSDQRIFKPNISSSDVAAWANATRMPCLIRSSSRVDEQTLVVAGDNGLILRSTDNGATWTRASMTDATAAILFIASDLRQVPWEFIGRESLENRLRTLLVVGETDDEMLRSAAQAAMRLGVASLNTYPTADSSSRNQSLTEWMIAARAPVVAIDAGFSPELKSSLLQTAVAHGAEKVVEFSKQERGETLLHRDALLPRCGAVCGDFASDARLQVGGASLQDTRLWKTPWNSTKTLYLAGTGQRRGESISDGVLLNRAHRMKQRANRATGRHLQVIQGRLKQLANVENRLLANVGSKESTRSLKPIDLSLILNQIRREDRFRSICWMAARAGGSRLETPIWQELATRFDETSTGKLAGLRLESRRWSHEWKLAPDLNHLEGDSVTRRDNPSAFPLQGLDGELISQTGSQDTIVSPFQSAYATEWNAIEPAGGVIQASASETVGAPAQPPHPSGSALRKSSSSVDLAWQLHPVRLLAQDAIRRNQIRSALAQNTDPEASIEDAPQEPSADLKRVAQRKTSWSDLLKHPSPQSLRAARAATPPRLDGKLTESIWTDVATTLSADAISLRVAYDDAFVYFATEIVASRFRPDAQSHAALGTRDDDVSDADHLYLGIDIDRDLFSAYQLQFTRKGRTRDSLDGSDHWNPNWYLASATRRANGRETVVTEIAIERDSLTTDIAAGDVWIIETCRVGQGRQFAPPWMPSPLGRLRVEFE